MDSSPSNGPNKAKTPEVNKIGNYFIRIRLDLVKHLIIKISERSFAQRFDDSMSSFSSEKRIKFTT